jgi:cytochrome b subunit of formate dehydrogenase
LVAGPEILISMELMGLVELLGASTFVLMYVSGLKLFLAKAFNSFFKPVIFPIYKKIQQLDPYFFIPRFTNF